MPVKIILSMFLSDLKLLLFVRNRKPTFDHSPASSMTFTFSKASSHYLTKLRNRFELDKVIDGKKSDLDRVLAVTHWTGNLWEHDGQNEPAGSDPISIIEEAEAGANFRCVEYAIALAGALSAVGFPARTLGLMMRDVETRKYGAGHVVTEAFLKDVGKWVMVDGQFKVLATANGEPASALEFTRALHSKPETAGVISNSSIDARKYRKWIRPYLYYLQTNLYAGYSEKKEAKFICLGPLNAPAPTSFQGQCPLKFERYTHVIDNFYPDADHIVYET